MSSLKTPLLAVLGAAALFAVQGCSAQKAAAPRGVKIAVAPLALPGIGGACYDLEVSNGTDVVWSKGAPGRTKIGALQALNNGPLDVLDQGADATTICSGQYGNDRGGDIVYVGPCDASVDSDGRSDNGVQNLVTLWVDGLYNDAGSADIGEWRDPCPAAGCKLQIDCTENQDSLAEFNFTIMRSARQGFFDIAVNFQNVFCSAKLDTCYPAGGPGPGDDDHIELLHGSDAVRDWTGVFGFACSAGIDTATHVVQTNLLYSAIRVTCGDNVFHLDPTALPGKASVMGSTGGDLNYGIYRGVEQLECGDGESCNKVYWNLALSLDDLALVGGSCRMSFEATVNDGNDGFENGLPTAAGLSYPYVVVDAGLTLEGQAFCQANPLDAGDAVYTGYRGNQVGQTPARPMCHQYDGVAATSTGAGVGCSSYLTNVGFATTGPMIAPAAPLGSGTGITGVGFGYEAPLANGTRNISGARFE